MVMVPQVAGEGIPGRCRGLIPMAPVSLGASSLTCAMASFGQRLAGLDGREALELTRPFSWRLPEAGNADAARQAAFDGSLDESRCDKGRRDHMLT